MAYIHAKFLELNAMVKQAAAEGGAEFVDTFTPTLGHDFCQLPTVRYGEIYGPSVNDPAVGVPAHPNAAGARAQAAVVLELPPHPLSRVVRLSGAYTPGGGRPGAETGTGAERRAGRLLVMEDHTHREAR